MLFALPLCAALLPSPRPGPCHAHIVRAVRATSPSMSVPTDVLLSASHAQRLRRLHCVSARTNCRAEATVADLDEEEMVKWIMTRGWASVLPMQPMLVQPITPSPPSGVLLTFRRKPTDAKGGTDGGLRFVASGGDDGVLLVTRVSEGQAISKAFSERILCRKLSGELENLPPAVGRVLAVVHADTLGG